MFRKTATLLAALLLFPVMAAANTDLQASLGGIPENATFGATIQWTATFTNVGNEARADVYMTASLGNDRCVDLRVPMQAGETRTFQCATRLNQSGPPYGVYANASIRSFDQLDADPRNNDASQFLRLESKPDLRLFFSYNRPAYPALPFTVVITYSNLAYTAAENVQLTFDVPGAISVRPLTEGCTAAAGPRVTCALGRLDTTDFSNTPPRIQVEVVAPDASATVFAATAEITSPTGDQVPSDNRFTGSFRTYWTRFVTNPNDSGDGSLRAAIEAANASCPGECLVAFRIPNVARVATIRPATPLPALTGKDVLVDGLVQASYVTDSNPAGPEIELRGSDLTAGDGLVLGTACGATVQGLAINGFPRHGIYATTGASCGGGSTGGRNIVQNYLGVDAAGTTAVPNFRGIYSDGPPAIISNNVISGNTRAGVFLAAGASIASGNTIGLDPTGTKPLGNGASGIYIGPAAGGTDATRNHIAFNGDAGVSIDASARYVNVYRNAIHANHQIAVDFGLDGPTPALPLGAPDVTAAQYDAATNTTTIAITTPADTYFTWIDVYANDAADPSGFGEGQTYLGQATSTNQGIRFVYPGDLRGKWIAAQGVLQIITTFSDQPPVHSEAHGPYADTTSSEFGRALQVVP